MHRHHDTPTRTAPARDRPRGERGSLSVQMVVIMPVMFTIAFTGMQVGLYFYGRSAALAAATTGAQAAAVDGGTVAECQQAAAGFIASLGDVLTSPRIDCARTATAVSVQVTGNTLSVVPFWTPRVSQQSVRNVERVSR